MNSTIGIVVIGRNEGERLIRCIQSIRDHVELAVYVDSGSTDDSVKNAEEYGATIVNLDLSKPFTAARARNQGFSKLSEKYPNIEYIQFVDGDCEVESGWLAAAEEYLRKHPRVGIVSGRRRERYPDESPYNRLAEMEWNDATFGESRTCGGDMMIRADAFREVKGYNPSLIAGEELDLSRKVRQAGYTIYTIDHAMTLHDSDMHRFMQWWKRQVRSGHAYAEMVHLQGLSTEPYWMRRLISIGFWGAILPAISLGGAVPTSGLSLGLLSGYAFLWRKIYRYRRLLGDTKEHAVLYANSCVGTKFAASVGAAQFAWTRFIRKEASTLIEYK